MDAPQKVKPSRNYRIDLLRIVSMLMIVMLHISGTGGIQCNSFANKGIVWLSRSATYCAVNCYALISGYVGIRSKLKLSSLAELWLRVAFYSVSITIIFFFTRPDVTTLGKILHSFFPVTNNQYWYFTAYVGMWFFTPIANAAVNHISKEKMGLLLIGSAIILTPSNLMTDAFALGGGYTPAWLFFLYTLGAYFGKYNLFKNTPIIKPIIAYSLSVIITVAFKLAFALDQWSFWGLLLLNYTSPTILISAVSLLAIFCNLKVGKTASKLIAFFAPLSFSVYLIHTHPLVFGNVFRDAFAKLGQGSPLYLIFGLFAATFAIYLACVAIDYIRHLLFKLCKIKNLIIFFEKKLWSIWDKLYAKLQSCENKTSAPKTE